MSTHSSPRRFPEGILTRCAALRARDDPNCIDYALLDTLPESDYSSLMPECSSQVIKAIQFLVGKRISLAIDAMAHIGTETISFARRLECKCIAIDNNIQAISLLRRNIDAFGLTDRCEVIHGDCVEAIKQLAATNEQPADFVYFDPPWGGRGYWKQKYMMVYVNGAPIYDLINSTLDTKVAHYVVLKAPRNIDKRALNKHLKCHWSTAPIYKSIKAKKGNRHIAYLLFVCWRLDSAEAE